jgi:MoxR-like ATPase
MEPPERLEGLAPHELEAAAAVGRRLADNVARAVEVDADVLRSVLVALAAEGHVLIEDYPGVGKTALARALARSIDGQFARIQCTADLLPADIVGTNVYNEREQRFEFRPGPIFANVVLVDEVNRASPKTQSGLLECMQERHVTVDIHTHELARPFLVLATQNPIEYEGTYPLPEALEPVVTPTDVVALQEAAGRVHAAPALREYVVELVGRTRTDPRVELGASPRAGLMLLRAAKGLAALDNRDHALPDDVQALAQPVLAHRLLVAPDAAGEELEATRRHVVADAVSATPAM